MFAVLFAPVLKSEMSWIWDTVGLTALKCTKITTYLHWTEMLWCQDGLRWTLMIQMHLGALLWWFTQVNILAHYFDLVVLSSAITYYASCFGVSIFKQKKNNGVFEFGYVCVDYYVMLLWGWGMYWGGQSGFQTLGDGMR